MDINNQESGKVPILEVFCVFEVRGAGQDRKVRRHLPAPGCTGAGFLSWGWFWATWYRSRCFLVGILGQIMIPLLTAFRGPEAPQVHFRCICDGLLFRRFRSQVPGGPKKIAGGVHELLGAR